MGISLMAMTHVARGHFDAALDIVHEDGRTAGETVYAPVNGTVTWTDRSTGGISIDIGGGHAVAMFHVDFDRRYEAGTPVSQGEPMGTISGSGEPIA